jgi:hypothetical protein
MVHQQPKMNASHVSIVQLPAPIPKKEEPKIVDQHESKNEDENEIIDVGTPEQLPTIQQQSENGKSCII